MAQLSSTLYATKELSLIKIGNWANSPTGNLVVNFAQRELRSKYKRSLLGWLWSLISPLTIVAIYSLVFGVFFRTPPPETANGHAETFALYLFSGLVVWNLFTITLNGAMDWVHGVSDLRKKIYFPTETAVFGGALAAGVQALIEGFVLVAIMIGLSNVSWTVVFLPITLLLVAGFGLGVGFFASVYNARYRDVQYLTAVGLNSLFFLTPIIYTFELVPDTAYGLPVERIIRLNPVTQFVEASRDAVYFLRVPSLTRLLAIIAYGTIPLIAGLRFFRRRSMDLSEEL